jgi:hypothetical protein
MTPIDSSTTVQPYEEGRLAVNLTTHLTSKERRLPE